MLFLLDIISTIISESKQLFFMVSMGLISSMAFRKPWHRTLEFTKTSQGLVFLLDVQQEKHLEIVDPPISASNLWRVTERKDDLLISFDLFSLMLRSGESSQAEGHHSAQQMTHNIKVGSCRMVGRNFFVDCLAPDSNARNITRYLYDTTIIQPHVASLPLQSQPLFSITDIPLTWLCELWTAYSTSILQTCSNSRNCCSCQVKFTNSSMSNLPKKKQKLTETSDFHKIDGTSWCFSDGSFLRKDEGICHSSLKKHQTHLNLLIANLIPSRIVVSNSAHEAAAKNIKK